MTENTNEIKLTSEIISKITIATKVKYFVNDNICKIALLFSDKSSMVYKIDLKTFKKYIKNFIL